MLAASALPAVAEFNFTQVQAIPVGEEPRFAAAGDLDGDGDMDLVVTNYRRRDISVVINDGELTFADERPVPVRLFLGDRHPTALALADVDGDGDLDLAVLTESGFKENRDVLSVLLNRDGKGTLGGLTQYESRQAAYDHLTPHDADGDGDIDLILTPAPGDGQPALHRNLGTGLYRLPDVFPFATDAPRGGLDPYCFTDLNADGIPDLVLPGVPNGSPTLTLHYGPLFGGPEAPTNTTFRLFGANRRAIPLEVVAIAYGSLGKRPGTGLVVALGSTQEPASISFMSVQQPGPGAQGSPIADAPAMQSLAYFGLIDLDADGNRDLVLLGEPVDALNQQLIILAGQDDGTFAPPWSTDVPQASNGVVFADLDADGKPELIVPDGQASLLIYANQSEAETESETESESESESESETDPQDPENAEDPQDPEQMQEEPEDPQDTEDPADQQDAEESQDPTDPQDADQADDSQEQMEETEGGEDAEDASDPNVPSDSGDTGDADPQDPADPADPDSGDPQDAEPNGPDGPMPPAGGEGDDGADGQNDPQNPDGPTPTPNPNDPADPTDPADPEGQPAGPGEGEGQPAEPVVDPFTPVEGERPPSRKIPTRRWWPR